MEKKKLANFSDLNQKKALTCLLLYNYKYV